MFLLMICLHSFSLFTIYNFLHGNKYLIAQHQHQLGTRKHQLEKMTSVLEGE